MIETTLLFNTPSIGSNNTAQLWSKVLTYFADVVLAHQGPSAVYKCFQFLRVVMVIFAGFGFIVWPHAVVQQIKIR